MIQRVLYLLYPSARPHLMVDAIRRARTYDAARIRVAVGCNGSKEACEAGSVGADLRIYYGETMFQPRYTDAVNGLMRAVVRKFCPRDDDLIVYWSDDFFPRPNWVGPLLNASQRRRFLAVNDGIMAGRGAVPIPCVAWSWLREHMGGMFWPPVYNYVVDVEGLLKARRHGEFMLVPNSRIDHRHYVSGQRRQDAVDEYNASRVGNDRELLKMRDAQNFPVTWSPVEIDVQLPELEGFVSWDLK